MAAVLAEAAEHTAAAAVKTQVDRLRELVERLNGVLDQTNQDLAEIANVVDQIREQWRLMGLDTLGHDELSKMSRLLRETSVQDFRRGKSVSAWNYWQVKWGLLFTGGALFVAAVSVLFTILAKLA